MSSIVITGANRGIGFAFLEVLSANKDNTVIGLVRDVEAAIATTKENLPDRNNIRFLKVDLRDASSIKAASDEASKILDGKLDLLIANAAAYCTLFGDIGDVIRRDPKKFESEMRTVFETNVIGTAQAIALFAPLIVNGKGKKIVALSTGAGDSEFVLKNDIAGQAGYATSKAALNLVVAKFQAQYKKDGIIVTAISPGIVNTAQADFSSAKDPDFQRLMGKFAAAIPPGAGVLQPLESVGMVMKVIESLDIRQHGGRMISHHGNSFQWI